MHSNEKSIYLHKNRYMDFSFFNVDNKSGYKTRETWFSKNYPEEYNKIIIYCSKLELILSFKEKIWFYYNNITERPKCKTCGKELKFRNRFDNPYGEFCSLNCFNNNHDEMIKRQNKTFQEKYGIDFYTQHEDFIKKQKETKLKKYGSENYNNIEKSKQTKLEKHGNQNYNNIEKYRNTCILKYNSVNYSLSQDYKNNINNAFKEIYPNIEFVTINKFNVDCRCHKCGEIYNITKQNLYERTKRNYEVCTICNPIGQSSASGYEKEICEYLVELKIDFTTSNRILKNNKEIDILAKEYNLGIEFDGVYWHNELFVPNDYHLNKTLEAQEIGIELLHIFEDEWLYKKDIVKSILKNRFHKIDQVIYARKCNIIPINNSICSKFLEDNHIQGNVNSKVRLGLFFENKLVSVMTFSKGRILVGGKSDEWELTRFCNLLNYNIIGGADKLFNYFLKVYKPENIISYSDIRLFNGGLYKKLGFTEIHKSKPNYWYVINDMRYHRFNFRKSQLVKDGFDKNKTEKQIMFERKIYRIYDCGCVRWEYKY